MRGSVAARGVATCLAFVLLGACGGSRLRQHVDVSYPPCAERPLESDESDDELLERGLVRFGWVGLRQADQQIRAAGRVDLLRRAASLGAQVVRIEDLADVKETESGRCRSLDFSRDASGAGHCSDWVRTTEIDTTYSLTVVLFREDARAAARQLEPRRAAERLIAAVGNPKALAAALAGSDRRHLHAGHLFDALGAAAEKGSVESVEVLLDAGADPRLAAGSPQSPVLRAIRGGSIPTVRRLVDAGARLDAPPKACVDRAAPCLNTPFLAAAASDSPPMIDFVTAAMGSSGAAQKSTQAIGPAPLAAAAVGGHLTSLGHLSKTASAAELTALLSELRGAAASPEVITDLIRRGAALDGADPYADGATPLMKAAAAGNRDGVVALLAAGADPNFRAPRAGKKSCCSAWDVAKPELRPILEAKGGRQTTKVKHNYEPSCELLTSPPLVAAASRGDLRKVESLLDGGVPIDQATPGSKMTALATAAECGHYYVVATLLHHGAQVDRPTVATTPLSGAVGAYPDVVELLLDSGADPNLVAPVAPTPPLVSEAGIGSERTVRLLLAKGARVDAESAYGATALQQAAMRGHLQVMNILLEAGADPNRVTSSGSSPLHGAAAGGQVAAIELLLRHGAKAGLRTKAGTAKDVARAAGHKAVVALLDRAASGS